MEILFFPSLASTNAYALERAASGVEPETVVWALEQSAGRGQYSREFSSPRGGLYFSLIFSPALPPERLSLITLAAGVGCCLSLEQTCAVAPLLKWPNDLYVKEKKLGGILTETLPFSKGRKAIVVVGVGLNINSLPSDFSAELSSIVTSLVEITKKHFDLKQLLESMVHGILFQVRSLEGDQEKLLAQWDQRDYLKGQSVKWDNGRSVLPGIGQGILSDGRYSLRDASGTIHAILAGTLQPTFTPSSCL